MEYLPYYSVNEFRRLSVLPGITGWAQVNGRNSISWDKKFKLDLWYVDNRNIWFDFYIIWLTLLKVVLRVGVNADDKTTMPPFKGGERNNSSEVK
jgi:lipopolysaccharide/colanic/teichoic acid biosynthesis glycosyltransferase